MKTRESGRGQILGALTELEVALGIRKEAAEDRWACLFVRRCLNFKVRR